MSPARFLLAGILATACASPPAPVQTGLPSVAVARDSAPAKKADAVFWSDTIRPLATLSRGWNRIPGRHGTGCAHDSSFAFRVRPGLPEKVMIFLNGGGACWRAQDCDPRNRPTYTMTADSANDVSVRVGLFDVSNPSNPVRDYTMIFVPSCTGDMHLGTRETEYEWRSPRSGPRKFAVRHGGAANLEAVLDWVYANIKSPSTVFIAGTSTGAIASPVVAQKIARTYPRARVVQLGDAAGGFRAPAVPATLWRWGATEYLQRDPRYKDLDSAEFTFEQLYVTAARVAPRVQFAQFNTAEDAAQLALLAQFDVKGVPLSTLLAANLADIRRTIPGFRSYTAPGRTHTILRSNSLYTLKVGDVKFVDWLSALVDGSPVVDVGSRLLVPAK